MSENIGKRIFNVPQAAFFAAVTKPTIISWCIDFKIGFKSAGRWKVYEERLIEVMNGGKTYGKENKRTKVVGIRKNKKRKISNREN